MRQVHPLLSLPRKIRPYDRAQIAMGRLIKGPGGLPRPAALQPPVAAAPAASVNMQQLMRQHTLQQRQR